MEGRFNNGLSDAEQERLAWLAEEMGEALQCVGKILRHGYESYNPVIDTGLTNRRELERELGHVQCAMFRMCQRNDLNYAGIQSSDSAKEESVKRWMHHQEATNTSRSEVI